MCRAQWARAVAKEFKARGDLGAVEVVVSVGANAYPTVVLSRCVLPPFLCGLCLQC